MRKFKIVKKPLLIPAPAAAPADDMMSFRLIDFNVYDCIPETNTHSSASENSSGADDGSSVGSSENGRGAGAGAGKGKGLAANNTREMRARVMDPPGRYLAGRGGADA